MKPTDRRGYPTAAEPRVRHEAAGGERRRVEVNIAVLIVRRLQANAWKLLARQGFKL